VRQDDSSRSVTGNRAEGIESAAAVPEVPSTSDAALRLAVKLAVDAGEYERAAAIVEVLMRAVGPSFAAPIRDVRGPE
jgi:hypothetical protein